MIQKPKLIIVTGRPGSGKTTLAKKLGELIKFPVFCRDEFKEGYVNTFGVRHDRLGKDTNALVTNTFFQTLDLLLERNISMIAEAAFQHKLWEAFLGGMTLDCNITFIICEIEADLAAKRHLERGLADPTREFYHGDKRVTHFKRTGEFLSAGEYMAPSFNLPTISVSTKGDYKPSLDLIRNMIFSEEKKKA